MYIDIYKYCTSLHQYQIEINRKIVTSLHQYQEYIIGASLSEPHLVRTMISLLVYIYISYVWPFDPRWVPRKCATCKQ